MYIVNYYYLENWPNYESEITGRYTTLTGDDDNYMPVSFRTRGWCVGPKSRIKLKEVID